MTTGGKEQLEGRRSVVLIKEKKMAAMMETEEAFREGAEGQCSDERRIEREAHVKKVRKKRSRLGEGWGFGGEGYMRAKLRKIESQFRQEQRDVADVSLPGMAQGKSNGKDIFRGVRVWVNGSTKPSGLELKRLLALHGGSWAHREQDCTHIIATGLNAQKLIKARKVWIHSLTWRFVELCSNGHFCTRRRSLTELVKSEGPKSARFNSQVDCRLH